MISIALFFLIKLALGLGKIGTIRNLRPPIWVFNATTLV